MIYIGMAVQPHRFPNLEKSLPILSKQCDKLWIVVNPSKARGDNLQEPTPVLPEFFNSINNIEIKVNHLNEGDRVKFFGLNYQSTGYYLTVDDDILYPEDYVSRHIEYLNKIDDFGITCVHASTFNPFQRPVDGFINRRKMYHFSYAHDKFEKVLMPGTGTSCFNVEKFKMLPSEMPDTNMADVWVMCKAAMRGVPVYTIPRKANWLQGLRSYGKSIAEGRPNDAMNKAVHDNILHIQKMFRRLTED